jgi:Tfp pilus assembly protein PilF
MVPRWRPFEAALALGELAPLTSGSPTDSNAAELLAKAKLEAQAAGSAHVSADLLSAGVALGRPSAVVEEAAAILEPLAALPEAIPAGLSRVTRRILGIEERPWHEELMKARDPAAAQIAIRQQLGKLKKRRILDPRNGFTWADMALLFETLGQPHAADRAMETAHAIYPNHRHILRSFSRMLIHRGDYERAQQVLLNSPRLRSDPWLIAAEISTADILGKTSSHASRALRSLRNNEYSPFHATELAAAMGTLELQSGDFKRGIKLFRKSAESPTENAVAQASWIERVFKISLHAEGPRPLQLTSPEAIAMEAVGRQDVPMALAGSFDWLRDQPFSSRPAALASFLLLYTDRFEASAAITQFALQANPNDATLQNNHAFALASQNKLERARKQIALIRTDDLDLNTASVLAATKGFIEYRSGEIALGQDLYHAAVLGLVKSGNRDSAITAALHWILEEVRLGRPGSRAAAEKVLKMSENSRDLRVKKLSSEMNDWLQRLPAVAAEVHGALQDPTASALIAVSAVPQPPEEQNKVIAM